MTLGALHLLSKWVRPDWQDKERELAGRCQTSLRDRAVSGNVASPWPQNSYTLRSAHPLAWPGWVLETQS